LIASGFILNDSVDKQFISAPTYVPDQRVWYKDSLVLTESIGIDINNNDRFAKPLHYTFINLKTREFYRYLNFSDTAKVIKQFFGPDSMGVDGVWNFYKRHGEYFFENELIDTTIKGENYRRIKAYVLDKQDKRYLILYLSCKHKDILVQLDKEFGDKMGCPIVRVDRIPYDINALSVEIEFLSDKFTPEEQKVFNAWEKYARDNPVKR
jgi:hypothetical protein